MAVRNQKHRFLYIVFHHQQGTFTCQHYARHKIKLMTAARLLHLYTKIFYFFLLFSGEKKGDERVATESSHEIRSTRQIEVGTFSKKGDQGRDCAE